MLERFFPYFLASTKEGELQTRSRAERNAVGAGRRVQRCQRRIAIGVGEIGDPGSLFPKCACPGQALHDPLDEACEECLELLPGGSWHGLKDRRPVREAIDTIKDQTMQIRSRIQSNFMLDL